MSQGSVGADCNPTANHAKAQKCRAKQRQAGRQRNWCGGYRYGVDIAAKRVLAAIGGEAQGYGAFAIGFEQGGDDLPRAVGFGNGACQTSAQNRVIDAVGVVRVTINAAHIGEAEHVAARLECKLLDHGGIGTGTVAVEFDFDVAIKGHRAADIADLQLDTSAGFGFPAMDIVEHAPRVVAKFGAAQVFKRAVGDKVGHRRGLGCVGCEGQRGG